MLINFIKYALQISLFFFTLDICLYSQEVQPENKQKNIEEIDKVFPTPLLKAIAKNQIWVVEYMLENGVSPNGKERSNIEHIPVLLSVWTEHTEILRLLIRYKANLEVKDEAGLTALMLSAYKSNSEIATILIDAKANVNAKSDSGATALMFAAKNGNAQLLKTLLRAGADVNSVTQTGATVLMIASSEPSIIKELLSAKANIDASDKNSWTAVFHAIDDNQVEKLEVLLKNGASVSLKDKNGLTPLMLAEQNKDSTQKEKIITLLKKYGARM